MQYDEGLRMAMVLKFLEYISYIKIKKSGPSSGSLHEKKCILLSVVRVGACVHAIKIRVVPDENLIHCFLV